MSAGMRTTWENWSGNLQHKPPTDGDGYYFTPTTLDELKAILTRAKALGATVRASGQRHSQPPLVADDNRNNPPAKPNTLVVDMSCYIDIGESGIELGPGANQITMNPGVREDFVDAFLTRNNLMFRTVTAGGFFSIGGMTAVDVHGATLNAPIFAETVSAFTILGADGTETVIDASTAAVGKWAPLQFARVSLGGLGIVTRITIDVLPRPYANTVRGRTDRYLLQSRQAFVDEFKALTAEFDRMEVFYSPYAAAPNLPFVPLPNFLVLSWKTVADPDPKLPNSAADPTTACVLAGKGEFGAPFLGGLAGFAAKYVRESQYFSNPYDPFHFPVPVPTAGFAAIALNEIESQTDAANKKYSDLWLSASSQVIFMSYFLEMPNFDDAGLGKVWDGMDVVAGRVIQDGDFHIAAPMEFRFIKAGDSAMSGAYSENPDAIFVNLDLIGFIEPTPSADYPKALLQFFADVERDWVAMGGMPHNGKMYGFYDPSAPAGSYTAPFNPNFLSNLRARRGERLDAFSNYRKAHDPDGLFYNAYLKQLLEG
jgi:hypothetical protein